MPVERTGPGVRDTMSGVYAEFVENEVLPLVENKCQVKLTKDAAGRAAMGGSSGGSCALIMAWYHPELYHLVLYLFRYLYKPSNVPGNPKRRRAPGGFMKLSSPKAA